MTAGPVVTKCMGQVLTDFRRLINNDMWQNGSLHLFYILKFVFFWYVMNTHLGQ